MMFFLGLKIYVFFVHQNKTHFLKNLVFYSTGSRSPFSGAGIAVGQLIIEFCNRSMRVA